MKSQIEYYKVLLEYHSKGFAFELQINWNVAAITGNTDASGYIVQHFSRISEPANFQVGNADYFEAWRVEKGICEDRGSICDDVFSVNSSFANSIRRCLGTKGKYTICGDVYWIPEDSDLFGAVDHWLPNTVEQAGGLKASFEFPELTDDFFAFSRPKFVHTWSLVSKEEIEKNVQDAVFHYCPKNTSRDMDLMSSALDDIFDGMDKPWQAMKKRIKMAWCDHWRQ